ncbi:Hypothetical predicted protein [Mytilus galloprovincialis]|uniref:BCAS3 WD40 domain-containing protein n=1 Tax=Mytilus galloprovincialis TaxID=29158 RepID=A0A8B6DL94_MYTGA|nr:Hypothetical predicted protein [Mytilus galloprovincialis]
MSDSSLLELLSVTDKAVKALNKSHSMHSEQSLESSVESTVCQSSADHGIESQIENKKEEPICYQSDVSTTASDVLIRSTLIDDEGKLHLSSSLVAVRGEKNESKCSKTSIGIDNFNSSGPQKVKMSTKKLREIRSPRAEEPDILFSNISSQTVNSVSNECLESHSDVKAKPYVTRHFREVNSQLQKPIKDSSMKDDLFVYSSEKNPPNLDIILHNDSPVTSDETTQRQFEYENSILPSSRNSSKDSEVLIERHTPKVTRATKNYPAGNKEGLQVKPKQMESKDSIDLIPHKEIESVNCSFSNSEKLEIITVPERIVTVSARTSLSTEILYKEKEDMMIPPRLSSDLQPAKKLSNHLIRQGAPVEGMELQDRKKLSSDVQISQSTVFDRQKIKEALTKRHENSGPVKRVIQPKFVKPKGTDSSETNKTDQMTASVAASVAMAATAPFLQAQQELENRMKDMLAKISEIQNGKTVNTSVEDDRVKELERQVTSLTEQRIQHLEKLQEHQAELQAKLLMMTKSVPNRGGSPPETPLHTPVIYRQQGISSFKPKKDSDKSSSRPKSTSPARRPKTTSLSRSNLSKGMTDDPCESPFDTPNPRSKAPKPVAFNTSRIKTQNKNNHTNMGILEEILASSESPRQTFSSPQLPVLKADIDEHLSKSPELRKAEKLVGDLSGINDDVKSLVHAYSGNQKVDDKEKILWMRFERSDINDISRNPDFTVGENKGIPLLLILGYSNGVQIWNIMPNGEAQEVYSVRQGPVRILRVLPTPSPAYGENDKFASKRPLVAVCDTSSAGQPYCAVKFVSLKTGDEVHNISFKTYPVINIECNKRVIVVVFKEKLCVFDAATLKQKFWITDCFPCTGPSENPVALGSRWLAYADKRLVPLHQSFGGMSGDGAQSYAATVISAAKGAFKGLSVFSEAVVSNLTGSKPSTPPKKTDLNQIDNGNRPGIISIVDLQNIHGDHYCVSEDNEDDSLVAHFHAHANEPVSHMLFDPAGTLLLTACKLGHNFHVFRIMAHPCSSSLGAVHHLFTLHRGDTTAKVIDMAFSQDSRWVTVSTHRGTTHVFPVTPYGGNINVRTHCKARVVNRASRFHKSAGIDDMDHPRPDRDSPILSGSPGSTTGGNYDNYPSLTRQNALNNNIENPRLPPYPHATQIYPLSQIKQPLMLATSIGGKTQSPTHTPSGKDNVVVVNACFSTPRLWIGGNPSVSVEHREGKRVVDSLFVMSQTGMLSEYILEPRAKVGLDKISGDSPLELVVTGYTQWTLQRSKTSDEIKLPLTNNNPLILSCEAVLTQQPSALCGEYLL